MAEEWVKNARGETKVALDAQAEVEVDRRPKGKLR